MQSGQSYLVKHQFCFHEVDGQQDLSTIFPLYGVHLCDGQGRMLAGVGEIIVVSLLVAQIWLRDCSRKMSGETMLSRRRIYFENLHVEKIEKIVEKI